MKMSINGMIAAALGEKEVDLVFTNARIVNVFSGTVENGALAVHDGHIVGMGAYPSQKTVDLAGRYIAPGLIDAHVHIESSMVEISAFARAVVPLGTTTVVADPHEIANVLGASGVRYMLSASNHQPMNVYFSLPSCVPATHMETAGAVLAAHDLAQFMGEEKVVALAEMMNYPGVIQRDPAVLKKIELARKFGKPVDGHAPGLSKTDLAAYVAAGISSDHECTTAVEACEKLALGMHIMIREGTCAKNLDALFPVINHQSSHRMMWCTDDRHPHELMTIGHIDSIVRAAIDRGLDAVTAIQMATINPARYFGLHHLGALAPGKQADLVIFSDLSDFKVEQVYYQGRMVAENGRMSPKVKTPDPVAAPPSMHLKTVAVDFSVKAQGKRIRVIDAIAHQVVTQAFITEAHIVDKKVTADPARDILKLAVVERHTGSGNIGVGFVRGFGLKQGALASSVAHDSHNIIVVGVSDEDMARAVAAVVQMGGGLAAAKNDTICASLALPIAGLMSRESVGRVRDQLDAIISVAQGFGCVLDDPFMTLGFLALPVIPELKLTDLGLVDVKRFERVSLFAP
jgi:adenine deaminase